MVTTPNRNRWLVALSVLLVGLVVVIAIAASLAPSLLPTGDQMGGEGRSVAAGVIFVGSYLALAIGRIPGLSIDRAGIALVGAGLMVASGALSLEDAYKAVDFDTITLLLGMMIVVASLRLSGFFAIANAWVIAHARRPLILLGAVVATSGVFSAFLVNDAICLVLAPLVLELTLALGRRPVPYLLAVAMASNVGSTATITGNPQNILIGSFSQIPYTKFALALGPVALVGLIVTVALIALSHRAEFAGPERLEAPPPKVDANRVLVIRALLATLILIALFFAGIVPAKAAIVIGGLLLLTRRRNDLQRRFPAGTTADDARLATEAKLATEQQIARDAEFALSLHRPGWRGFTEDKSIDLYAGEKARAKQMLEDAQAWRTPDAPAVKAAPTNPITVIGTDNAVGTREAVDAAWRKMVSDQQNAWRTT
jgi:Citrate transporter